MAIGLIAILASCSGSGASSSSSSSSSGYPDDSLIKEIRQADFNIPGAGSGEQSGQFVVNPVSKMNYAITEQYGEHEAFLEVDSVFPALVAVDVLGENAVSKTLDGPRITYQVSSKYGKTVSITVNASSNTVSFSDFDTYASFVSPYVNDATAVYTYDGGMSMIDNGYSSGGSHAFDLDAYGIDILYKEGKAYIPAAACSYLFLDPNGIYTAWNGEGFYFFNNQLYMLDLAKIYAGEFAYSPFGKAYYGGPYNGVEPSQDIATLHGNESMFYLDHFYGFPDREDFEGRKYSQYLKEEHPEEYALFFSTGKEDSQKAWDFVTRTDIGDGHTNSMDSLGSFYAGGSYTRAAEISSRNRKTMVAGEEFRAVRKQALGLEDANALTADTMFQTYGDMAVIRFDSFETASLPVDHQKYGHDADFYKANMAKDAYYLFAYAFGEIAKNPEIKKVVIDLSCNGGGSALACLESLCFFKDQVSYNIYNPLTKSNTNATMKGKLPGRDKSYEGEYDFYVLTSYLSFSCGNLFPTIVKKDGSAKLVGQKTGGGACVVSYLRTPDGQYVQISGLKRLSMTTGQESNDEGIEPDIDIFDLSYYYDMAKLRSKLS